MPPGAVKPGGLFHPNHERTMRHYTVRNYTVILLYPDYMQDSGRETYITHVSATNPDSALRIARRQAVAANPDQEIDDPTDFAMVAVFLGHHEHNPTSEG